MDSYMHKSNLHMEQFNGRKLKSVFKIIYWSSQEHHPRLFEREIRYKQNIDGDLMRPNLLHLDRPLSQFNQIDYYNLLMEI